mgnify:CR=1 FL=1
MRTLLLISSLSLLVGAGGCTPAATLEKASFLDPSDIEGRAQDWRGPRKGAAYLQRHYEVQVGVAKRASDALSRMRAHIVRVSWDKRGPIALPIEVPKGARMSALRARIIGPQGIRPASALSRRGQSDQLPSDPAQEIWSPTFAETEVGEILEVICDFEVPGTIASDARAIAAIDGPTEQLLIRYDVPQEAKATMQIRGAKATPVLTKQEGKQVFALFMTKVPAQPKDEAKAHVRYVTLSASVRGYKQSFAGSWSRLSAPYTKALVSGSGALRMNHREPYRAQRSGIEGAKDAYQWVRQRLQLPDALEARWDAGRPLPSLVTTNTLNATDKVHLLRWLLDAAGIKHSVAAVRSKKFVNIDPKLPFPGAFDGTALYLPEAQLWLDPACQSCEAGQVREDYRGAWGLVLPAPSNASLVKLPD